MMGKSTQNGVRKKRVFSLLDTIETTGRFANGLKFILGMGLCPFFTVEKTTRNKLASVVEL